MNHFSLSNLKCRICFFSVITINVLLTSCNFNVTDIPGPQISSTIESSKKHGTFICEYKLSGDKINGLKVESIFAEKKYWLRKGFWSRFDINCCASQLIIVFKDDNTMTTLNDIPQNWEIIGFHLQNSRLMVTGYGGIILPNKISLEIRPDVKNIHNLEKLTLEKVL